MGERLVTVIVPQGRGMALLQELHGRGTLRAALSTARAPFTYVRGSGVLARTVRSVEKDVLHVVVSEEKADEVFEYLYRKAGIGDGPGGFMFMAVLSAASLFTLGETRGGEGPTREPPSRGYPPHPGPRRRDVQRSLPAGSRC
jgi:hypothetical protein